MEKIIDTLYVIFILTKKTWLFFVICFLIITIFFVIDFTFYCKIKKSLWKKFIKTLLN